MIANRFTRWLARRLYASLMCNVVAKRPADFIIGGADTPYMHRWYVIPRNRWLNVYLHHVVRDDDDRACHDHPWQSLSLMLAGLLGEVYEVDEDGLGVPVQRVRFLAPGATVWRRAKFSHRLFLSKATAAPGEAWTLFITGPRLREWGFWCPGKQAVGYDGNGGVLAVPTDRRWVHWKDFTAAGTTGDSAKIGRGCE